MISFEDARKRLKNRENICYTGTPAKFNVEDYDNLDREKIRKELKLNGINKNIILVTCGSQGAKKVNEVVLEMVSKVLSKKYFIILVTGDRTYDEILLKKKQIDLHKEIFIKAEHSMLNEVFSWHILSMTYNHHSLTTKIILL